MAEHHAGVGVPETLEELLTPGWLTAALAPKYPGVVVTAVAPGAVMTRVSTNALFAIECEGGLPPGLPAGLCAKGYFSDTGNWAYRRAGEAEAAFYRDMAGSTGVATLRSVYADVDGGTGHGVVITEDLGAAGGVFVDPAVAHTPTEVAETLEMYAVLHGRSWGRPGGRAAPWLVPRIAATTGGRTAEDIQAQFDGPVGTQVPAGARDGAGLLGAYRRLPAISEEATAWCLLHGDAHLGNLYRSASGRFGLLDWQLVQPGMWGIDVGYHVASSLSPGDRRRCEHDLLAHYLDRRSAEGVPVPGWAEVWAGYRAGVVYGTFLWSITQKVRPEITAVLLGRLGTAADDQGAYGLGPVR
ncbi:MAG TPA: phosphotransferase [Acidimicrobiales bacterium]|nr:phosphotransferase [Acidimicrobiales bacterium]